LTIFFFKCLEKISKTCLFFHSKESSDHYSNMEVHILLFICIATGYVAAATGVFWHSPV